MSMMMVMVVMAMPMVAGRMPAMVFHFVVQHISKNGATDRAQEAMVLLMSKVIPCCTAGERTSQSALTLWVGIFIGCVILVSG